MPSDPSQRHRKLSAVGGGGGGADLGILGVGGGGGVGVLGRNSSRGVRVQVRRNFYILTSNNKKNSGVKPPTPLDPLLGGGGKSVSLNVRMHIRVYNIYILYI